MRHPVRYRIARRCGRLRFRGLSIAYSRHPRECRCAWESARFSSHRQGLVRGAVGLVRALISMISGPASGRVRRVHLAVVIVIGGTKACRGRREGYTNYVLGGKASRAHNSKSSRRSARLGTWLWACSWAWSVHGECTAGAADSQGGTCYPNPVNERQAKRGSLHES